MTGASSSTVLSQPPPPLPFQVNSRNSARPVGSEAKPLTTKPWVSVQCGALSCQLGGFFRGVLAHRSLIHADASFVLSDGLRRPLAMRLLRSTWSTVRSL